jgi:hypothetical protein
MCAMSDEAWQKHLQCLCERFSHLGMGANLAALSIIEAWGLSRSLRRLTGDE